MKLSPIRLKYLTFITALLLVISGCQSGEQTSTAKTEKEATHGEPSQGGELSYALATSPDTLDPHTSRLAVSVRVLRTMYDSLVVQLPDNTIQPWLATEWTVSPDRKSYTFKLREDVKFHDGTPFNAEAAKYNFDRIMDPKTKATNAFALLQPYSSSEVTGEYTIKVDLGTPSEAFLSNLSQALLGIISPTAAEKSGDQFGQAPVGTGPFKFIKWEENADIQVEKNPDYNWAPVIVENKGQAYLDKITFKIIPEEATRIGSVQSGQVLASESIPPQNILSMKNDPNVQVLEVNTVGLPYTLFFNQRREPWNEEKARKAIQLAVDVDAIVKTLYLGTYERAWSPLTPGIFSYDKTLEKGLKPNLAKANKLLDELGYVKGSDGIREKDGKKLTLQYVDGSPNREKRNDIAVMVQQQLKKVGVKVEIELTNDIPTVIYTNADYDIHGNSQVNSDPDALRAIYQSLDPHSNLISLSGHTDKELTQLLEQGAVEQDLTKREEIYKKVQHHIIDHAIIIPIYIFPYTVAADKTVKGLTFDPLGYPLFNGVSIEK
ncbi:ABC transporter substrate-binding protein [Peribacillus loiseleuriae]|uniref:ABC transporter substrate-binding protein n=1 Tax=Peribacillus loiseleuriae TaxID=1679170 RepID=UPI003D00A98A